LGSAFKNIIREPRFPLQKPIGKRYEPDFILQPHFYDYKKSAEVLEIKLPTDAFLQKKEFHTNLRGSFFNHLRQVKNYQRYLRTENNKPSILNALNFQPDSFSYSILAGRAQERDYNIDVLKECFEDFNLNSINLITYDDLLARRAKMITGQKLYKTY
jgi:hypothetical protein